MIDIPSPAALEELNVLVIDDQSLVHDTIKSALLEMGIRNVKCAGNAFFALRLCEQTRFDIVIISFNVKSDKDGFHLLEEMRFKKHIKRTSSVIFLSAETSSSLVNCVVELQPSDFWVKPLDRKRLEARLRHVVAVREKLFKLNYCVDIQEYSTAIYYAERQLKDPELAQYYPNIQRLKGECLCLLNEFEEAERFYRELELTYAYGWVQAGILKTLLKQDNWEEAECLAEQLEQRDDTRFAVYDLLAQYFIEKEEYEKAYEQIKHATALAPRNVERNKKSCDLARLNHDKWGLYHSSINMARYAKNSIHDSPQYRLNVIRASIDLATSMSEREAAPILVKVERQCLQIEEEYGKNGQLDEQLAVIRTRVLSLRNNKKAAEALLNDQISKRATASVEDNLDKVKAFHELGYREESIQILDAIKAQIGGDSFTSRVVSEYIAQEKEERETIHFTAKELGEMASTHYQQKRYKPALTCLNQALTLSPKNAQLALSALKVLSIIAETELLDSDMKKLAWQCINLLEQSQLGEDAQAKYQQYLSELNLDADQATSSELAD